MSKKTITTRVAAVGLAAAAMVSGFTGCDKDKKNTEPSKENKESIVTTVDMPSKTEPVVITTEPATTEIATTEPVVTESTEIVTTEPVVETTEEKVEYINLNNVKLVSFNYDTGNCYYTMELDKVLSDTEMTPEQMTGLLYDEKFYEDLKKLDMQSYRVSFSDYVGIGLSEGCSGNEIIINDLNGKMVGVVPSFGSDIDDSKVNCGYVFYFDSGTVVNSLFTSSDINLLYCESVSAAKVLGVEKVPRKKFIEFLKTLEEINFDTIVDQWAAFQS